jgi:hypothetical protein
MNRSFQSGSTRFPRNEDEGSKKAEDSGRNAVSIPIPANA